MRKKEVLCAVIGGIAGAVLVMAAGSFSPLGAQSGENGSFDKVSCKELNVIDSQGNIGIKLCAYHIEDEGLTKPLKGYSLKMFDLKGNDVVHLHSSSSMPSLVMSAPKNSGAAHFMPINITLSSESNAGFPVFPDQKGSHTKILAGEITVVATGKGYGEAGMSTRKWDGQRWSPNPSVYTVNTTKVRSELK